MFAESSFKHSDHFAILFHSRFCVAAGEFGLIRGSFLESEGVIVQMILGVGQRFGQSEAVFGWEILVGATLEQQFDHFNVATAGGKSQRCCRGACVDRADRQQSRSRRE